MSTSPETQRRAAPVVGACLFAAVMASVITDGGPAFAQLDLEQTPTSATAPANTSGAGTTRGIARRPAAPTQATIGTVAPSTTAVSSGTDPSIVQGTAGNSLIPPPPVTEGFRTSDSTTAVSSPTLDVGATDETGAENEVVTDGEAGSGWFTGANVTNGGLVSAGETPGSTPTTAMTSTTAAPPTTAPTPTTAASSPGPTTADTTVGTTAVKTTARDVGRGRTSRLLEVAAVIAGVIGLSAVPVLLARLVRARSDDETMEHQAPA